MCEFSRLKWVARSRHHGHVTMRLSSPEAIRRPSAGPSPGSWRSAWRTLDRPENGMATWCRHYGGRRDFRHRAAGDRRGERGHGRSVTSRFPARGAAGNGIVAGQVAIGVASGAGVGGDRDITLPRARAASDVGTDRYQRGFQSTEIRPVSGGADGFVEVRLKHPASPHAAADGGMDRHPAAGDRRGERGHSGVSWWPPATSPLVFSRTSGGLGFSRATGPSLIA